MIKTLLVFFAFLLPIQAYAQPAPVTVFAAASLRGALDEVSEQFNADVALSFGGSGTLARQIAAGAPADLVLLAAPLWMDWLQENGVIDAGEKLDLLGNSLVLIAPASEPNDPDPANLAGSLSGNRLAVGQRDAVPAGIYARQWLQATGQWEDLLPMLAETDNVRTALALVARGDAPLGIVYRTDALAEPRVRIVFEIPNELHSPITYPVAALTDAGRVFLAHLQTPESQQVFERHGFSMVLIR